MTPAEALVLLDTNVWIDLFVPSRTGFALANKLVDALLCHGDHILYPARIMPDVFYRVRAEAKGWLRGGKSDLAEHEAIACRDHAWDCVKDMQEIATAVAVDESDVWLAMKYRALNEDLEENFILAAARRAQANYLVTSDRQLIGKSPVPAFTPAGMLDLLEAGLA